jgi:hypothetical protein
MHQPPAYVLLRNRFEKALALTQRDRHASHVICMVSRCFPVEISSEPFSGKLRHNCRSVTSPISP